MKKGNSSSYSDQRGAALVIAILAMLLIGVLAVAFMSTGKTSQEISQNSEEQTEAFFISEAGLTHGTRIVMAAPTSTYTTILQTGSNTAPGTWDELSPTIPSTGVAFGSGSYRVTVLNDPTEIATSPTVDNNQQLIVRSEGTGLDGSTVTTEA